MGISVSQLICIRVYYAGYQHHTTTDYLIIYDTFEVHKYSAYCESDCGFRPGG